MFFLFFILPSTLHAEIIDSDQEKKYILSKIKDLYISNEDIKNSIIDKRENGFYYIFLSPKNSFYMSFDGKTIIRGHMTQYYDSAYIDQSSDVHDIVFKEKFDSILDASVVYYKKGLSRYEDVYIISDYTCPFCTKLHNDIDKMLAAGLRLVYLPISRADNKEVIKNFEKVLCLKQGRKLALDYLYKNKKVPEYINGYECEDVKLEKIRRDMKEIRSIAVENDVSGTPAIFNSNGLYIGGLGSIVDLTYKSYYKLRLEESRK